MAFRIDPARPLGDEVRRNVADRGAVVTALLDPEAADPAAGFHDARKALKSLRALVELVRPASPAALKAIEADFRDCGKAIAERRDQQSKIETLDRFIAAFPRRIVSAHLGEIRFHLLRAAESAHDDRQDAARARSLCVHACERLAKADLSHAGAQTIALGTGHTLTRWRKALRSAKRRGRPADFHALRKAVKAHAAQLNLLGDIRMPRRHGKRIAALGERLGELNDIHVMRDALRRGLPGVPAEIDARPFDRLLRREAKRLSAAILPEAKALLGEAPRGLGRRFRKAMSSPGARPPDSALPPRPRLDSVPAA